MNYYLNAQQAIPICSRLMPIITIMDVQNKFWTPNLSHIAPDLGVQDLSWTLRNVLDQI